MACQLFSWPYCTEYWLVVTYLGHFHLLFMEGILLVPKMLVVEDPRDPDPGTVTAEPQLTSMVLLLIILFGLIVRRQAVV